jgi:hypothetical protein
MMNRERLNYLKEICAINCLPEDALLVPWRHIPLFIKGYMIEQHRIEV